MGPDAAPPQLRRPATLAAGAMLAGGLTYIGLVDPHRPGSLFPPCPFKLLTGWNCPACGGLRMTHDLLHGQLSAAVTDNAFLLFGLPMLALWVLLRLTWGKRVFSPSAVVVLVVLTLAWTVARNVPGFPLVPTILQG